MNTLNITSREQLQAIIEDIPNKINNFEEYCYAEITFNNFSDHKFEIILRNGAGFATFSNEFKKINDCILDVMKYFNLSKSDLLN
jgi:hypothetical protein